MSINRLVWDYCNDIKAEAREHMPEDTWQDVKKACDELMCKATGGGWNICPGWYMVG